jgi:flavin-dependent dehydrogenase
VREGVRVTGVERRPGARTGVRVLDEAGDERVLRAPLVVGADGLRSVVGAAARARAHAAVAAAHRAREPLPGIEGWASAARCTWSATATWASPTWATARRTWRSWCRRAAARGRRGPHRVLRPVDRARPQLAPRFAQARRTSPVRATGPFGAVARRAWAPGAALVGDAADFFDPFTGEGIYAGLRGGELVAPFVREALAARTHAAADRALAGYEEARRREFGGKWIVERMIGTAVAVPFLINRAASVLSRRRDMADLLVGVAGDFVPPAEVLNAGYLLRLFLVPPSVASGRPS